MWEYKWVHGSEADLNQYGQQGWRVIAYDAKQSEALMERPALAPQEEDNAE